MLPRPHINNGDTDVHGAAFPFPVDLHEAAFGLDDGIISGLKNIGSVARYPNPDDILLHPFQGFIIDAQFCIVSRDLVGGEDIYP